MTQTLPTAVLGRTGLEVSRLGYGTALRNQPNHEQWGRLLNTVLDSGINFIDTANDYGVAGITRSASGPARVMLPVIREQGAAYVIGGIFSVPGRGVVNGALFRDERLLELARTTGISIAALSVRFLLANREITTILVGASTPEELEESVVAAQAGPLPPDIQQTLEELAS